MEVRGESFCCCFRAFFGRHGGQTARPRSGKVVTCALAAGNIYVRTKNHLYAFWQLNFLGGRGTVNFAVDWYLLPHKFPAAGEEILPRRWKREAR